MKRIIYGLLALLAVAALVSCAAGEVFSRPARRVIGAAPADLQASSVHFPTRRGDIVSGWFARSDARKGAVLLLHGVRGDRGQMIPRARWLKSLGYSVLLIDLPAHGVSTGDRITFGLREGEGVRAAMAYLRRELPGEPVAVIGVSLGAASTVLARLEPAPAAVVLESMYPDITEAVEDRLAIRLGKPGRWLAPLLLVQLPLRLDVSVHDLRPIDVLPQLHAPVFLIAGSEDQHTRLEESLRLFEAAMQPKQFWVVQGAAHVDLYDFDSYGYRARTLRFLEQYLQLPQQTREERDPNASPR